jgi:3-hydroxyacyl-CoA dehydrogenase
MPYGIEKVGVIGAGAMGAGIAAIVANAGIPVVLLDMPPTELTPEQERNGLHLDHPLVRNSLARAGLERIRPPALSRQWNRTWDASATPMPPSGLMEPEAESLVTVGNLEDHFHLLSDADWIVEAIIEKPEPKRALMERLEGVRKADCLVTTNTSGLPVASLAQGRSPGFRAHFFGSHFFNPPRYLRLLEIITLPDNGPETVGRFVEFAETVLGKKVVRCNDTPNFIANRIVAMTIAFMAEYALSNGYTIQETDLLTGPLIGRSRTATFFLQDWVGIDVVSYVTDNLYRLIPEDPLRELLAAPLITGIRAAMMQRRMLGLKSGQGFYKQSVDEAGAMRVMVLDPATLEYEKTTGPSFAGLDAVKGIAAIGERLTTLFSEPWKDDRGARLAWATVCNQLSYAAQKVPEIVDTFYSVDNAMRWGFGYDCGPFELWDRLGVARTAMRMEREGVVVASWVGRMLASGCETFYRYDDGRAVGCYDLPGNGYRPLPLDDRIIDIDTLRTGGREVRHNRSAAVFDLGDGILLLELHHPLSFVDEETMVMAGVALDLLKSEQWTGLVIAGRGEHFCRGVSPDYILETHENGTAERAGREWQRLLASLRHSPKPVVAAIHGRAVCGGAEMAMSASRCVAHAETNMGLLEVMADLIPGGGGIMELVRRTVSRHMAREPDGDAITTACGVLDTIGMPRMASCAAEARSLGFLEADDLIIANRDFLLHEARQEALKLARDGYMPRPAAALFAGGKDLYGALKDHIVRIKAGNAFDEHESHILDDMARIIAGGTEPSSCWVDERIILDMEQRTFVELMASDETLARLRTINGQPSR